MEVIKHGKKRFITTCSRCGCVFAYGLDELIGRWPLKTVHCPDCDEEVYHKRQNENTEKPEDVSALTFHYYDNE